MNKIKKYTVYGLCVMGLFLSCLACTKEEIKEPFSEGSSYEVGVHTYSTGENITATLFFWDDLNFHELLMKYSSEAEFYGSVGMERSLNSYRWDSGETFSTGLRYREEENSYLHATGYAPTGAFNQIFWGYHRLQVNEQYLDGKTDFLCCDGNVTHRGSLADPFTNKEHELKFRHLMSHIKFVGKRDPVMYDVISVNNVRITLHNASDENKKWSIPTEFALYCADSEIPEEDKCTYLVSDSVVPSTIELLQDNYNYIPADTSGLVLFSCYVHQAYPEEYDPFKEPVKKKTSYYIPLTLDISADFSWYNDGSPVKYDTPTWTNRLVEVESKYGDTMWPGYEYVVYITFKRDGIALQGVQQAWEDGGIHYLPVVPEDKENQ